MCGLHSYRTLYTFYIQNLQNYANQMVNIALLLTLLFFQTHTFYLQQYSSTINMEKVLNSCIIHAFTSHIPLGEHSCITAKFNMTRVRPKVSANTNTRIVCVKPSNCLTIRTYSYCIWSGHYWVLFKFCILLLLLLKDLC